VKCVWKYSESRLRRLLKLYIICRECYGILARARFLQNGGRGTSITVSENFVVVFTTAVVAVVAVVVVLTAVVVIVNGFRVFW